MFQVTFKSCPHQEGHSISVEYLVKYVPRVDDVVRLHGVHGMSSCPALRVQRVEHDIKQSGEHAITVYLKRSEWSSK